MTNEEALERLRKATFRSLGALDPDMVFGGYSRMYIVEAMNDAISCTFVGPQFTVVSVEVEFCVYFDSDKIDVSGMAPRRKR